MPAVASWEGTRGAGLLAAAPSAYRLPMSLSVGRPVPAALAEARVQDAAGAEEALGAHWATRDCALVFVRHFACAGCSAHVEELRPRLAELAALDVAAALVGCGSPPQLADFLGRHQLAGHPLTVRTDPALAAYRAAELERTWLGTMGPRALASLARLASRGHTNGLPRGDLLQQGGTLYVRRGGELALHHRSARLGDHAPVTRIVELALAAGAARAAEAGLLA
jgi:peroxiredoxin